MRARTTYVITTAIIVFVMIFSIYKMYSPEFAHLGYPDYFRTELTVAKILGLIVLVVPGLPLRWKDAAYVGFGIVLISAAVSHLNTGDSIPRSCEPLGFLVVLIASNVYLHKQRQLS
jgi:hypothetical protein